MANFHNVTSTCVNLYYTDNTSVSACYYLIVYQFYFSWRCLYLKIRNYHVCILKKKLINLHFTIKKKMKQMLLHVPSHQKSNTSTNMKTQFKMHNISHIKKIQSYLKSSTAK